MIYIDFLAGAHGNFLEFACNTALAGIKSTELPFNNLGASHKKVYDSSVLFKSNHYFSQDTKFTNSQVISVKISPDDLLPLSSISLLRAGDRQMNNDELEINTYTKFNNDDYRWVLDNIINNFSHNQIQESYNAIKDESWPLVYTLEDFKNLPKWIQDECLTQHNLHLVELSENNPDCPRWVLREFFKLGFKYPEQAGFITEQRRMQYDNSNDVYYFPFACFYDTNLFCKELMSISKWAGLDYTDPTKLHKEFLKRQPYYNNKRICDEILERIYNNEQLIFPTLDLMMESYLEAKLELCYNINFPVYRPNWFTNSQEILTSIKQ